MRTRFRRWAVLLDITVKHEHMLYVQHMLMFHHQPVRREDNNSILNRNTLVRSDDFSLQGLTDVGIRGGDFGRFEWDVDGIPYQIQYLPPSLERLHAPPELMLAQMDYVGVDKAVFQTGHSYGCLNRYLSDSVAKHPDRFWGLAMVDEWKVDQASEINTLDIAINELGLHGLWFQVTGMRMHGRREPLDHTKFRPFWNHVRNMNIPVFWFVNSIEPGKEPYMSELQSFGRWRDNYPEIPVVFTHGLPLSRFTDNGCISIPEEVWSILSSSRIITELLIPISQGVVWEYPFAEAQPIIREYYERLGPDNLAWGSDMPNVERHCTYKQSLDYLRRHCKFISRDDMTKICGDNIASMFSKGDFN
jgi:predicted TIM-barrel fold metal-dependent hydrolase